MGSRAADEVDYRVEYVPQRLRALDACMIACHTILSRVADDQPLKVYLGQVVLTNDVARMFVEVALDAGMIANRDLLNCMGIKLDNGNIIDDENALT